MSTRNLLKIFISEQDDTYLHDEEELSSKSEMLKRMLKEYPNEDL